jgi:chloramphenicol O-acetyltransferase type A
MKYIDMENWSRKSHFNYFKNLSYPHFSISTYVDITEFYKYIKEKDYPFFISFLYASVRTANSIKEFRYRIREDKVVEHEIVNPSFTVMTSKDVFSFCPARYIENFGEFLKNTSRVIEETKNQVILEDEPGRDDLLFITSIPWVSFTSVSHPIIMNPVDSIPRISWGRYFEENGKVKIPMSIQAHHAIVDGVHIGQYFNTIQEILDKPSNYFLED